MATTPHETPLLGGRITAGIVRVGDTVRRPSKPTSRFVAQLLAHLEDRGCAWAPRWLGEDDLERDILSWVPGSTPETWARFEDAQLRDAALILRQLHDITRSSQLARDSVVCHNDPGPHNFVFHDDVPVALIDYDMAAPGHPLEDLGYMAWSWCISSSPSRGPVAGQAEQVRTLADAYGLPPTEREKLPGWIMERQRGSARFWSERLANPGDTPTPREKMLELIAWSQRELRFTEAHREEWLAALLG